MAEEKLDAIIFSFLEKNLETLQAVERESPGFLEDIREHLATVKATILTKRGYRRDQSVQTDFVPFDPVYKDAGTNTPPYFDFPPRSE